MNKKYRLTESKTFCMAPWVHLHTNPSGIAAPCCIAQSCSTFDGVGDAKSQSMIELVNSPKMKQLRLDMLNDVKNPECAACHNVEDYGVRSSRNHLNIDWGNTYYDECIQNTKSDGSLSEFKMRYFDIRFSNICNFKCRSCGAGFSSQWEQEDLKNSLNYARVIAKNDNKDFLNDVINQIQYMDQAYFAGGEPLITEEHYILLEEMIKQGRTNIKLRYNTNLSNLKFKDKDLLGLWKHFEKEIMISASIDHYGERAEYIRHGTDWATVENNFKIIRTLPYLKLQMHSVLSVFNMLSMHEFYQYLFDKKLYDRKHYPNTIYNLDFPEILSCNILPPKYKEKGKQSLEAVISMLTKRRFRNSHTSIIKNVIPMALANDTWEDKKEEFRNEIHRLDKIRGEDFSKTFPELAGLL